jgi:hypothetical protein
MASGSSFLGQILCEGMASELVAVQRDAVLVQRGPSKALAVCDIMADEVLTV